MIQKTLEIIIYVTQKDVENNQKSIKNEGPKMRSENNAKIMGDPDDIP